MVKLTRIKVEVFYQDGTMRNVDLSVDEELVFLTEEHLRYISRWIEYWSRRAPIKAEDVNQTLNE